MAQRQAHDLRRGRGRSPAPSSTRSTQRPRGVRATARRRTSSSRPSPSRTDHLGDTSRAAPGPAGRSSQTARRSRRPPRGARGTRTACRTCALPALRGASGAPSASDRPQSMRRLVRNAARQARRSAPRWVGRCEAAARRDVHDHGLCVVSWLLQLVTGGTWTHSVRALGRRAAALLLTAAFLHSTSPVHILLNKCTPPVDPTGPFLEQQRTAFHGALPALRARRLRRLPAPRRGADVGGLVPARRRRLGAAGSSASSGRSCSSCADGPQRNADRHGINFAIGLFFPGMAWQAHLGGLVVGLALGAAYAYAPRALVSVGATVVVVGGAGRRLLAHLRRRGPVPPPRLTRRPQELSPGLPQDLDCTGVRPDAPGRDPARTAFPSAS